MATIKLFLGKAKKDRVNIRVRVVDTRKINLYYTSEITIPPEYWDEKQQNIKSRISINLSERNELQRKIKDLKTLCEQAYYNLKHSDNIINSENFTSYINNLLYPQRHIASIFFNAWDEFLGIKEQTISLGVKVLRVCRETLIHYEKYIQTFKDRNFSITFENVNDNLLRDFYKFIIEEYKYVEHPAMADFYKDLPRRQWKSERHINTANARMKKFRTFWLWAMKKGYTERDPFKNFTMPTDRYATPIFLLPEEVKKIYTLDLSDNDYLQKARDIFIFQCMVGCRREDLWGLTKNNIQNGVLVYVPKKTLNESQRNIRVPLNNIALEILEKYKDNGSDKPLPLQCCIDYYNRAISQIAHRAKLDRKVTIINKRGEPEVRELQDVLTSHIARKTFISTLINNGVSPQVISSMSGHVPNSSAFARYFTIEDDIKKSVVKALEL